MMLQEVNEEVDYLGWSSSICLVALPPRGVRISYMPFNAVLDFLPDDLYTSIEAGLSALQFFF